MDISPIFQDSPRVAPREAKHITILGAGLAGLVAAYELERLGHHINIMEGSPRIGGRIWTHRFGQGADAPYGELGAMRIPSHHKHVLHYIRTMGLGDKLCKFVTLFEEPKALMNIEGNVFSILEASDQILNTQTCDLLQDQHYCEETRLFAAWLKLIVDSISSGELRDCLEQDLRSHLMDELEQLDLKPFIKNQDKTIDLHAFIQTYPEFRSKCSQALDLFLGDILMEISHDLLQLQGGMDQLTHRLAESIQGDIACNQEVVALHILDNSVEVDWVEDGKRYQNRCDYVLCTIPFSVLRKLDLQGFDSHKLAMIHKTVYWPATKVLFHCHHPFWKDRGISGGASFSDNGIRQIYYPSIQTSSSLGNVLLASYTIGNDAEHLGAMSERDRYRYVQNALSQIHPEIQTPGMITDQTTIAWNNYKWSAGGCSVPWNKNLSYEHRPYKEIARPQNTLFFAGEHCSRWPAWMEGSVESALQAVQDIIAHKSTTSPHHPPTPFISPEQTALNFPKPA